MSQQYGFTNGQFTGISNLEAIRTQRANPGVNLADMQNGMTYNMSSNSYQPTTQSGMDMGSIAGYIGAGAGVLEGLSGLASAYTAYKGLQLAKKQFGFEKALANRNLANQAKIINNNYDNAAQVAAGMIGGGSYNPATDTQGSFGMTDQAVVDKYADKAKEKYVDGSAI